MLLNRRRRGLCYHLILLGHHWPESSSPAWPQRYTLASPTLAHAGWRLGGFEQRPDSCIIFQHSQGSCWNNEGKWLLIVSITAAVLRVEAVYLLPLSVYLARILIFENKA